MPKFSFPLVKSTPTDSEYAEICTGGGLRPHCQLKASAFSGAAPPSDTYGNLSVVNLPLQNETAGCETLIEVFMQTGCPPGTPDVVCDDVQNPTEIAQNSSETIYILDGNPPYIWEIAGGHGFTLEHESTDDLGGRSDERLNSQNTLYSSTESCGTAKVKIVDNCQTEIICEFDSSIASDLEYDWVNSGQTVIMNGNVGVFITGGKPPYTWNVSGVGFSVQDIETYSLSNTIYADSTACGSGVITIEDVCGFQVEGSVRCSDNGQWSDWITANLNDPCVITGQGACSVQATMLSLTLGEYQVREYTHVCYDSNVCPDINCAGTGYTPYSCLMDTGQNSHITCGDFAVLNNCHEIGEGWYEVDECCYEDGGRYRRILIELRQYKEWVCP